MITKVIKMKPLETKVDFLLTENQYMLIAPVGDIHFGSEGFPTAHFRSHLEWCAERGAMFLGMGEYLDFASWSQRNVLMPLRDETKLQIDEMVRDAADEFLQLAEFTKGRWLGMLEGDHRWIFQNGTSLDQYLCEKFDCDFLGTSALLRLVPNGNYKGHPEADCILYCHHGIGSSRTQGGHLHRVEDLLKITEADIYLMGHTHAQPAAPIDTMTLTPDGKIVSRKKVIARTGSFMRAYIGHEPLSLDEPAYESRGSYVEQKAYVPASLGGMCIGIGVKQVEGSRYYHPTIHYRV